MKCCLDTSRILDRIETVSGIRSSGWVKEVVGITIKAALPNVRVGDICKISRHAADPISAEIVGFRRDDTLLMPLGNPLGISTDSTVESTGKPLLVKCGVDLKGRIVDGLGRIIGGVVSHPFKWDTEMAVHNAPPDPLTRIRISRPVVTGIRAIDGFLTAGLGQRLGVFAAAGTGKSTLLGQIAKAASVDVNVIALIGERGREVRDFIEDSLGDEGMMRSVVIVATSDQPSLIRLKSAFVATSIAEYFRELGLNVLLMMDSVTRFARAQREVGLAIGEPPSRGGYTPSVFSVLPQLLERSGNSEKGSITALYTVLVAGDDLTEPVADEVISILDGHIILSRKLAARHHYPAIDILNSKSRVMPQVISTRHMDLAGRLIGNYAIFEENRDAVTFGFYKPGTNPQLDEAIRLMPGMERYLRQTNAEISRIEDVVSALEKMMAPNGSES